jgi:hypothetical protein
MLDLDELVSKTRDPASRAQVSQAVAAYNVGALRAAVISIWTTVVFDILSKVRELELSGDQNAAQFLGRVQKVREAGDIAGALQLERTILDVARNEFELLTEHEHQDLTRLLEDRHRCAHPSLNADDEAYEPTPELVRYHLRSALTHLLVHPPVQGKAALTRLFAAVESPLFPKTVPGASVSFGLDRCNDQRNS